MWIKSESQSQLLLIGKSVYSPLKDRSIKIWQCAEDGKDIPADGAICVIESDKFSLEIKMPFNCSLYSINNKYSGVEEDWICKVIAPNDSWRIKCMDQNAYNLFTSE